MYVLFMKYNEDLEKWAKIKLGQPYENQPVPDIKPSSFYNRFTLEKIQNQIGKKINFSVGIFKKLVEQKDRNQFQSISRQKFQWAVHSVIYSIQLQKSQLKDKWEAYKPTEDFQAVQLDNPDQPPRELG